jgi:DNA primase
MEIQEIKQQLTLATILHHYGLKPDKNNRLQCPFHEDKTPSMQVYYKTHTAYCFSSNCKTHGKSLDVIDFIMNKESTTKHEAINKCVAMLNGTTTKTVRPNQSREQFLGNMFQYFKNAVHSSKPTQEYLQSRALDFKQIEVGYNAGQFHHGTRKEESLINQCVEYGLLIDRNIVGRTGEKAYNIFGKWCLVFGLKNKENHVVSFYFRSILNEKKSKHFYLKNRTGLYPNYPNPTTKKLILTESIIDCASLLQIAEIVENYSVLACYGTNGLNEEIQNAILDLKELEEIIFAFDNDEAGNEAVKKYAEQFRQYKISTLELPSKDINETLQLHEPEIFTELLEKRKSFIFSNEITENTTTKKPTEEIEVKILKPSNLENTVDFLKQKNLLQELNKLIEKSGIIGEENSRLLLFIIASSYKTKSPLHAIVQGSSGSGKTHLISKIADLIPQEDVLRFTRITESSLYNWGEFDLVNKLIIIEDLDGLKEEAMFAMRELISNQRLSSSVSIKDKKGNIKSTKKEVKGVFSSLSATTKGDLYEDNMSRSFLLAVDESEAQTNRIITYQNKRIAGEINDKEQEKAKMQLQQIMRILKNEEVQNPFATQIQLPENVQKKRRLNEMFQSIIKQITILNQYQRTSKNGKIQTEIEDVESAVEILFESIILKIDELDGSLRQFFEKLKKKFDSQDFTRFEAMETTGFKKTQLQHYINQLVLLEYIKQFGHGNKGFKYKISYFDDIQSVRKKLKEHFKKQLEQLKPNTNGN